jgi:hypothetical protein
MIGNNIINRHAMAFTSSSRRSGNGAFLISPLLYFLKQKVINLLV